MAEDPKAPAPAPSEEPQPRAWPEYQAMPGKEDRHGEMTGAISINMMMSMLPVTLWVFLSPIIIDSLTVRVIIAVALAIVLPLVFLKPSQWVWAWISTWMDSDPFRK